MANVPASLHGTVMLLDCEPIDAWPGGGAEAREAARAHLPVQGMQSPAAGQQLFDRGQPGLQGRSSLPDIGDI